MAPRPTRSRRPLPPEPRVIRDPRTLSTTATEDEKEPVEPVGKQRPRRTKMRRASRSPY
jgi:hypothetical protein